MKDYKLTNLQLLAIFPLLYSWFFYLERVVVPKYNMHVFLDDLIPFTPIFIIPYLFWFIFMYGLCIYFWFKSPIDFRRTMLAIYFGFIICCVAYALFPNGQMLRPHFYANDIFSQMVRVFQENDTPTNVAPSLHVYISLVLHAAITTSKCFDGKKAIKVASLITIILICLSTVFLKQHSAMDGFFAVLLFGLCYFILYTPKALEKYENLKIARVRRCKAETA